MKNSTTRSHVLTFLSVLLMAAATLPACTTGLAAGGATTDGRCLLWKNRDSSHRNNEMVFLSRGDFQLIGVINSDDTTQIWAGINNFGFAIMNAEARDMAKPGEATLYDEEGYFMKAALLTCRTVVDFEIMLGESNAAGRGVTSNFGVIDASGQAAFYETGNHEYFRYNAADVSICPTSFLARANFAERGYGEEGYGYERYQDALDLSNSKADENVLDVPYLISTVTRNMATVDSEAGDTALFKTSSTVNRHRTVSCSVFEGAIPGEDPRLSTYWITLGEPSVSVAVPLWVNAGEVPAVMDGAGAAPLNLLFQNLKSYVYPDTSRPRAISAARLAEVQRRTDKVQKWVFRKTARQLGKWRKETPAPEEVAAFQLKITGYVMKKLGKYAESLN